ncbi:MAG: hypothetical protein ACYSX0_07450 [Planctomycetota bacterium]|jgi:hypothetical protein
MTRALISLLVLLAAPLAVQAAEQPTPLEAEVSSYLREAPRDRPLLAPASGGMTGWLLVQVHAWYPSLDGKMSSGTDLLDFQDDLGLTDNEFSVMPIVQVSFGISLRLDGFFLKYSGTNTLTNDIEFGGITFPAGTDIASEVGIEYVRLMMLIPVVKTDALTLYLEGGLAYVGLDGNVAAFGIGVGVEDIQLPLPLIGVLFQSKLGDFVFEVEASGLTISYSDLGATVFDGTVSVGYTIAKFFGVRVGYRFVYAEGEADSFLIESTIQGGFAGLTFQF